MKQQSYAYPLYDEFAPRAIQAMRANENHQIKTADMAKRFFNQPTPANIANISFRLKTLKDKGLVFKPKRGVWQLTDQGMRSYE